MDSNDDIVEIQWTKRGECVSYDMIPILPTVDNGIEAFDFVVYELDETDEDWIGTELARLEDAIVVTATGSAVNYTMDFTAPDKGTYQITLGEVPENNDLFLNAWKRGKSTYCSVYTSNGSQTYEETTFMGALQDGDIYDLRAVSFTVDDHKLQVEMTPASETTYQVSQEPSSEAGVVKVDYDSNVVVNPAVSPVINFELENITEATTISVYVTTEKSVSAADATATQSMEVTAGTKYTGFALYCSHFNAVGKYYVYYKLGDGTWCDTPAVFDVAEPSEAKAELDAGYTTGKVGEALSEDVTILLKNDSFKADIAAGTDVTAWFTSMPADWTATVKEFVAAGGTEMVVTIACTADKTVECNGFIGLTVPAEVLTGGNALTTMQTIAYKVEA